MIGIGEDISQIVILGRNLLHVVDNHDVAETFPRIQLQAELILDGAHEGRAARSYVPMVTGSSARLAFANPTTDPVGQVNAGRQEGSAVGVYISSSDVSRLIDGNGTSRR
jgi:hypothetical protein